MDLNHSLRLRSPVRQIPRQDSPMVRLSYRQGSPMHLDVHPGGAFSIENPYERLVPNTNQNDPVYAQVRDAAASANIVGVVTAGALDRETQKKVASIRRRIIRHASCHYAHDLGFCLDHNYNVSDIEELLRAIDLLEPDTHLTAEDLRSEQVCAALREFNIHMPHSTGEPPTGERPPTVVDKAIMVPSRIGYTSPTLSKFVRHHLLPLLPEHPLYPEPGTTCVICQQVYDSSHPPVLITNCHRCRHIFGYPCLRQHISSGQAMFNSCPMCRTKWFMPRRHEAARIRRRWQEVWRREQEAVERENEAFGLSQEPEPLAVRSVRAFTEAGIVTVELVKVAVASGVKWLINKLQEEQEQ